MTCKNCDCNNCHEECKCIECTPELCECKKEAVKPQDDFGYISKNT